MSRVGFKSSRGNRLSTPIANTRGRWIAVNRYIPLPTGLGFLIESEGNLLISAVLVDHEGEQLNVQCQMRMIDEYLSPTSLPQLLQPHWESTGWRPRRLLCCARVEREEDAVLRGEGARCFSSIR